MNPTLLKPSWFSESAWCQLPDTERVRVINLHAEVWYERHGKYLTDAQWISMLTQSAKP